MIEKNLLFTTDHLWVRPAESGIVRIGVTNYAQSQMEGIVYLDLPEEGEPVEEGGRLGDVEHVKKVTELVSPVSGTVSAVNREVLDNPALLHVSPEDSWLVEVRADRIPEGLMTREEYDGYVRRLLGVGRKEDA